MSTLISSGIGTMGNPNSIGPDSLIPLVNSFKDWWNSPTTLKRPTESSSSPASAKARLKNAQIEYNLFRAILSDSVTLTSPGEEFISGNLVGRFVDVPVQSGNIHEFELINRSDPSLPEKHVVMCHGYMAAMGFYVQNFEHIAKLYGNLVLHAIDMPGFGNSARPEFPAELLKDKQSRADQINQVVETELWFISQFEAWRAERGIPTFMLIAHSMGAYLFSCYILKYGNVSRFVVVSPMGTESSSVSLLNNEKLHVNLHASNPLDEIDTEDTPLSELSKVWERVGKPRFPRSLVLKTIWDWHLSPFQILQKTGPLYSKLLLYWTFQRFAGLTSSLCSSEELLIMLHDYLYSVFNQYQGLGELAITKLINHEVLARLPLCDRGLVLVLRDNHVKTLWLYGSKDWMNKEGGRYVVDSLVQAGCSAQFEVVQNAGHHIYLDNPTDFNRITTTFLFETP